MNSDSHTLTIESLAYGGDGVAHLDGRVVFIPDTLPGDVVRIRVAQDKGTYLRGALVELMEPSPDRVTPPCPFSDRCGGCQWLGLAYPAQLAWKRAIVEESLRRIGHIDDAAVEPCVPSPETLAYRTVARFPARQTKKGLEFGYFARRSHQIVDIGECPLSSERITRIARYIRAMPGLNALDPREITISAGYHHPSALVSFVLGRNGKFEDIALRMLGEIEGLEGVSFWREGEAGKARRLRAYGSPYRYETVREKTFRIEERSFFQINVPQAENMTRIVGEMTGLDAGQKLVDGYGGVGLFSLSIASPDTPVHLFDVVEWAVEDAVHNAREMGFSRFSAFAGDAKGAFERAGEADRLIVDPPRTGLGLNAVEEMCRFRAGRIAYVSCNPTTLARDLMYFMERGYAVRRVVPVDMFPHTYHIETVALLELQ